MNPSGASNAEFWTEPPLSDGEIDFLWWFIQGSLMNANVRSRLHDHWGLCRRHSLAFFIVESAFRPHLIHGCTILYDELMRRAVRYLDDEGVHGLVPNRLSLHFLRTSGPCHICDLGYGPGSPGNAPAQRLAQGRDLTSAIRFASANASGWLPHVCGVCSGNGSVALCRPHLVAAMERDGGKSVASQRERVKTIATRMARFDNSFRWEQRDTDTPEDRGALIAAIGWCSGWESLLHGPLRQLHIAAPDSTGSQQNEPADSEARHDSATGERDGL